MEYKVFKIPFTCRSSAKKENGFDCISTAKKANATANSLRDFSEVNIIKVKKW